ncbi:hypothetical protein C453_04694 [Haloferax elongans ATCC BAA-1513]|uniref:SRPBCC family protein n=1 Tax=Haloferax elongans ATCC BAA-1513 TaxID=1230453 RepID=M0HV45_HALEO|nr:hypothetical protein [Haloferax elongans]ELZ87623.1 hypothetical protein C453_04694 [Haloferax elongans ATCC BAA-1513]
MGIERLSRALGIAGATLAGSYLLALRPWHRRWGTTDDEASETLPGDDFVDDADWQSTRAITIAAPARAVWPWLVQMGQGRSGFYSYERLESLFGLQIDTAGGNHANQQQLDIGDEVRLGPRGSGLPSFHVAVVNPGESLVLSAPGWETGESDATWTFALHEVAPGATRLVIRFRGRSETLYGRVMNRLVTEPIQFLMERKMLKGIRTRVERGRSAAMNGRYR